MFIFAICVKILQQGRFRVQRKEPKKFLQPAKKFICENFATISQVANFRNPTVALVRQIKLACTIAVLSFVKK